MTTQTRSKEIVILELYKIERYFMLSRSTVTYEVFNFSNGNSKLQLNNSYIYIKFL